MPRLTLTAKISDEIVGFIVFTKAYIGDYEVLALAPLAVYHKYQNQKIGTFLVNYSHDITEKYGYTHSIVLGNSKYYSRFDYKNADTLVIKNPFDVSNDYFMVKVLNNSNKHFNNTITYDNSFYEL